MVTFKLFIDLFLSCCFGLGIPAQFEYQINGPRLKKTSLDEFFPVKILGTPSCIQMIHFNGSGDIKSAVGAQAIAHHPQDRLEIPAGTILKCYHIS
jgi:molybdopterin molybdotransferase